MTTRNKTSLVGVIVVLCLVYWLGPLIIAVAFLAPAWWWVADRRAARRLR